MMIERGKTILLNLLVITSFVLSWLLWTSQPNLEPIDPGQYLDPNPLGKNMELDQLLLPQSIVFHFGENRHTKALPEMAHYHIVLEEMKKWYFYDFQPTILTSEDWKAIIEQQLGLEIVFHDAMPTALLQRYFTMEGLFTDVSKTVQRILLYYEPKDQMLYALFVSGDDDTVIRARTAVTLTDLKDSYLSIGNKLSEQIVAYYEAGNSVHPYYLPKERETVRELSYRYHLISDTQIKQTFFINPSLSRNITERDGTIIYTDGNHAIQITPDKRVMTYHEPVLEVAQSVTPEEQLVSVISFINQHGGWTGDYMLGSMNETGTQNQTEVTFREYIGSYPVFGSSENALGKLVLHLDQGNVSSYQRSLVQTDELVDYKNEELISGPELLRYLDANDENFYQVKKIFLAYKGQVSEEQITLVPVWALERADGQVEFAPAKSSQVTVPPPPEAGTEEEEAGTEESAGEGAGSDATPEETAPAESEASDSANAGQHDDQ